MLFALLCLGDVAAADVGTVPETAMIANAAERGSASAQVLLAINYLHGEGGLPTDPKRAAYWFEQAALQGKAYAQERLADLYEQGLGLERNLKLALDWREKAANRGSVRAQYRLGLMYRDGVGVAADPGRARYWLGRAAVEGSDEARAALSAMLGRQVEEGAGTSPAASEAVILVHTIESFGYQMEEALHERPPRLQKIAEDGDAEAQYQLALRYESGAHGYARDYAQALQWFERAAASGHVMAMRSLAHIYEQGLDGTRPDPALARQWTERAQAAAAAGGQPR